MKLMVVRRQENGHWSVYRCGKAGTFKQALRLAGNPSHYELYLVSPETTMNVLDGGLSWPAGSPAPKRLATEGK